MQLFFIFGLGLSQGMMGITSAITWPRLFGLTHLGAITGFALALNVAGSAVGPFTYSLTLDLFGSYRASGILFASLAGVLILFALLKRNLTPYRRAQRTRHGNGKTPPC
jgi:MFS family permease